MKYKKLLSILLSASVIASLMPITGFAQSAELTADTDYSVAAYLTGGNFVNSESTVLSSLVGNNFQFDRSNGDNGFAAYLALDISIIAERIAFDTIVGFLNSDLFKALAIGHAPRKCHNCGRYFLLSSGYNTCGCNEIDPNDPKGRTCRKVGAHRKEPAKENKSPAEIEYTRAYGRLKSEKGKHLPWMNGIHKSPMPKAF